MIDLYEHNKIAYESAVSMLAQTGKAAVIHPTGTGKSFIGFKLCEDNPDMTVCWLSPSEYIFRTQLENLKTAGGEEPQNIRFFTYAKLMNMSEEEISAIKPQLTVFDEFHRAGAAQWKLGVERFLNLYPDVPILGLTATAIRYLDNQRDMADELFDGNIASEMTLGEAIVRGILHPPKYVLSVFAYQKDLERYQNRIRRTKNKAVRDAAERYLEALRRALDKADGLDVVFDRHMTDRTGKYIVFCANKEHMDEMMEKTGGWFARVDRRPHVYSVYSDDPSASKSFADFKADDDNTHLRLLYCIDALNEGIHVENVSGVILLRPTISPIIYKQQIGRTLSAGKGKEPVIFDIVMNIENLYSIDSVEEEMRMAMTYYRQFGDGAEIVNEQFRVIDELRDCRELFERLNDTLTASWDVMYEQAKQYYETYGNLDVPRRYKTADGYSLGQWINAQRGVYRGTAEGLLGKDRIDRLNAIGMIWGSASERTWKRCYAAAEEYFNSHGDLNVPSDFVTETGLRLGTWIVDLRIYRKGLTRSRYLTAERIAALDKIGMSWQTLHERQWDEQYEQAARYFAEHGDLKPSLRKYPVLANWLAKQRQKRRNGLLSDDRFEKLSAVGMVWELENAWERKYELAKEYYEEHGNLDIPAAYITEDGVRLGAWFWGVRSQYRNGTLTEERIKKMEAVGIRWDSVQARNWMQNYGLAKEYYEEHGNLDVPADYTTGDGVRLGLWCRVVRTQYRNGTLTEERRQKMEAIGVQWDSAAVRNWRLNYELARRYYQEHGNLNIPTGYETEDGVKLGAWIGSQRYRRKKNRIPEDQLRLLDEIGMRWQCHENKWDAAYRYAETYFGKKGALDPPLQYRTEDGFALGRWVASQRRKHAAGELNPKQVRRLETLHIRWAPESTPGGAGWNT